MKIFTWNVLHSNKKVEKGLDYIFAQSPDVVVCQEIRNPQIKYVQENYGYHAYYTVDYYIDKTPFHYIAVFTKNKASSSQELNMEHSETSLWTKALIWKGPYIDTLNYISVNVDIDGKDTQVLGVHTSASVRTKVLMKQISQIIRTKKGRNTIILGDFNTFERNTWNTISGPIRSFKREDYKRSEIAELRRISKENNLQALFNENTNAYPVLYMPLDNIIIPKHSSVIEKKKLESFGSDHHMLYAEVAL